MNKYLIVGLGNIGNEYNNTRHNIGFKVIDELSDQFEV
ncbi:MAG: aminoacyl-tRNA hydrolase, partial [Flavobacteriales bacterium]